jgi:hypothetical protein
MFMMLLRRKLDDGQVAIRLTGRSTADVQKVLGIRQVEKRGTGCGGDSNKEIPWCAVSRWEEENSW